MLTWLVENAVEDAPAVVRPSGEAMTFGDLALAVRATAEVLLQAGLSLAGRGVGVEVPDQAGALVGFLAALEVGAVPILSPSLAPHVVRPALVLRGGADDRLELESPDGEPRLYEPEVGAVVFSSGTSGQKAILLPGHGIKLTAETIGHDLGLSSLSRAAVLSPLHHVTPLIGQTLATLRRGGAVLALSWSTAVDMLPSLLRVLQADSVTAPPSVLGRLARATLALPVDERPALRFVASAGAAREKKVDSDVKRAFPGALYWDHYGLSEAGGRVASGIGQLQPIAGTTVVAVDEQGRVAARGQLRVSSRSLMLGYLDEPEATKKVLGPDGLLTGDLGHVTDGVVVVDGRIDDQCKIGLQRVHPTRVAEALAGPGVGELCVLATADSDGGQRLCCFVAASPNVADRIRERARLLPPAERPARIVELDQLPHLDGGKVDHQALRRMVELR